MPYESDKLAILLPDYRRTRIEAYISLQKADGTFTQQELAIIDTGAGISLIPKRLWKDKLSLDGEPKGPHDVGGISHKADCRVPTHLARIKGILFDDQLHLTDLLAFNALLVDDDLEKPLLGIRDMLDQFVLYCDVQNNIAYLEGANIHQIPEDASSIDSVTED